MSELQDISCTRRNPAVEMYACSTINAIMAVAMTARKLSLNEQEKSSSLRRTSSRKLQSM
jgi:hypothetical protein